jgi:hypothetical protein
VAYANNMAVLRASVVVFAAHKHPVAILMHDKENRPLLGEDVRAYIRLEIRRRERQLEAF